VRLSVHPTERGGLNREADMLEIEISDDGRGLAPEAPPGVGLASMRDRAEEVGGSLTVRVRHRGGTRVAARLPLAPGGKGERL
jgi:two-component system, NarL family, sensor kinase